MVASASSSVNGGPVGCDGSSTRPPECSSSRVSSTRSWGPRIWRAIDHAVAVNYPPEQHPETTPEDPEAADHLAVLALADVIGAAHHEDDDA